MSARWLGRAAALAALSVVGCSSGSHGADASVVCDAGLQAMPCANTADGGSCALDCGPGIDAPNYEGATHVAEGSTVNYCENPPASGNHYPVWLMDWGLHPENVPRERWVHNLEHGGIVLLYNCPSDCPDVVAQLTALRNSLQPDRYNEVRVIITADHTMPKKLAALAWGWRWQGDTLDVPTVKCFIADRYDHGPESIP